ncbi:transposase [Alphaproteobacteria bacterium]
MGRPYSKDFREIVLKQIADGEEVCMMLGISKTSVFRWENLKEENGDVSPKKNGNKPTKANHKQLMQIIIGNPNLTQKGIDVMIGITAIAIRRTFQRIGVAFKKNTLQRSKTQDKRRVFRENHHLLLFCCYFGI